MKKAILILLLFYSFLLQSCFSDNETQSRYDIYRVEVGTHLNIRDTPSKKGAIVGKIESGTLVDVMEIKDGWAKLNYDGYEIGYVSSEYLVLVKKQNTSEDLENPNAEEDELGMDDDTQLITEEAAKSNMSHLETSESTDRKKNVFFMGDSTIIAPYEKERIEEKLKVASEYIFIINAVGHVPTGELFDYAPDLLKSISKEIDSTMNWWQRVKSWFGGDSPSSNIVLLSYIKDCNLIQAECNGNSLKYLKLSEPEKYFNLQYDIRKGLVEALIGMGLAIDKAGYEYSQRSWFVRGQINTGNIFEYICDDLIVENILPRDSFWHKWVFGWIFAWPLKTANWIFVLTGSYLATLIILMLLVLGFYFLSTHVSFLVYRKFSSKQISEGQAGCLMPFLQFSSLLANIYLWLCMLSLIVYMMPDMCNIVVMANSGYSKEVISTAVHTFMSHSVTKNWLLVIMFFLGIIISFGLNEKFALLATLPSYRQKIIFQQNKKELENSFLISGQNVDMKDLENSQNPYNELAINSEDLGKTLGPAIPLAFVFSGTLLLYASIFLWTKSLKKLIHLITGVFSYKKRGLY